MTKIVVTQPMDFLPDQKERLNELGDVTFYDDLPATEGEWLERCQDNEIICTGKYGFRNKWGELNNVFISVPYVGVGFTDPNTLKINGVTLSSSPGCNRHAVSEWIIGMMITIFRHLDKYININELPEHKLPIPARGLAYKKITVLGKGNVGERVGTICESLEMSVSYFKRGDNLANVVKDADVVVDTLSSNPGTNNLLDEKFFNAMKDGAIFISATGESIVDIDAMLLALDSGKLAFVAHDSGGIQIGDTRDPFYQKLLHHPNVYVTPHISYNTDVTQRIGNDMMIDNIEAWLKGKPQNVVA